MTTLSITHAIMTTTSINNFTCPFVMKSSTTTTSHHVPTTPTRNSACPSFMGRSDITARIRRGLTPERSYMNSLAMRYSTTTSTRPVLTICSSTPAETKIEKELKRSDFPKDFVFGAGSAAYQVEGGEREGGRGPSIWDKFTHEYPQKIADGSNGSVANDSFHRYKEDVHVMKTMGLNAYRLSISWSRILPTGRLSGGVSREGIDYYNNLIDELLKNGITPFVTLFHWDLPMALDDEYGGFLSEEIVNDFRDYANLCFWEFGDRIKYWITLNEPWSYCYYGHHKCSHAPGGYYPATMRNQLKMYDVTHHLLLAHANAAALYKEKYQKVQNGKIGIVNVTRWFETVHCDNKGHEHHHQDAGERQLDFVLGWFTEPLITGEYPKSMKERLKDQLPNFSKHEQQLLKNSCDFIGLNYYTAYYAVDKKEYENNCHNIEDLPDSQKPFVLSPNSDVLVSGYWDGQPIGEKASSWLFVYPNGLTKLLTHMKNKYNNPPIYITENGVNDPYDIKCTNPSEGCKDTKRKKYIQDHLCKLQEARKDDVNVMGYFVWSLMDNFEWSDGYLTRFGLIYVDYKNDLARHPKDSALWYMNFLRGEETTTMDGDCSIPPIITTLPGKII